ncbi:MAG: FG-GAP repeat protein [Planctomycetota bacterium]
MFQVSNTAADRFATAIRYRVPMALVTVLLVGLATGVSAQCVPTPLSNLVPTSTDPDEALGSAIARWSSWIAVGRPHAGTDEQGGVVIFSFDGSRWSEDAALVASASTSGSHYGSGLDLAGGWLAAGAPDTGNGGPGFVTLFRRVSGVWVESQTLTAPDPQPGDEFGAAVSVGATWLLVGAPGDDDAGTDRGAVHLFERVEEEWEWRSVFSISAVDGGARLGAALDESSVVMLGAPGHGAGAGALVTAEIELGNLVLDDLITAPDPQPSDAFGSAVSGWGQRVAVGAPGRNSDAGAVFMIDLAPSSVTELSDPLGAPGDRFGHAVAQHFSRVVIGAPGYDAERGRAFYSALAGTWSSPSPIGSPGGDAGDARGSAVEIDALAFTVGSVGEGAGGAVARSELDPSNCVPFVRGDANNDGAIDIGDAITGLAWLFTGGAAPWCSDAFDVDDDGDHDIIDTVRILEFLFDPGPSPLLLTGTCESDATMDTVGCAYDAVCP